MHKSGGLKPLAHYILQYFATVRLVFRLILFMLGLAILVPWIKITTAFRKNWAHQICMWVHQYSRWCFNVGVSYTGTPVGNDSPHPVLYVCNHISWMDIAVLGSIARACFVAKAELEDWPVFGPLADLQRTIYVRRENRHEASAQKDSIADRLASGANIILFPEGTSGLGHIVLPFKSSLFGLTDDPRLQNLIIQPVTISYTHLNAMPLLRAQRAMIAWVGDMGFGAHAAQLLIQSSLTSFVQFHPPVRRSQFANRKLLSAACQAEISGHLQRAYMGRSETSMAAAIQNRLN
jgi:lyso-ornithine lipid O-acyltransferase